MAQVDTQCAFQHSSQHSSFYYPSSSSHSGNSSNSNSHHSSPKPQSPAPQRYCSPQCYPTEDSTIPSSYHSSLRGSYAHQPPRSVPDTIEDTTYSPFPAYDQAISSHPEPLDEDEEMDFDELEEDDEGVESPGSAKSGSPTALYPLITDDIWTERGPGPSRQVDYLSHDWQEPDIWASWRYVRKEKAGYPQNAARLENASWRTWAKSKYKLKTITPETLNWYSSPICFSYTIGSKTAMSLGFMVLYNLRRVNWLDRIVSPILPLAALPL
jgi:Fungal protein of unknown function (DUF1752)